MSKLSSFFLHEMARPTGWLSPAWKGALELARQSRSEFTTKHFAQWLIDSGVSNQDVNKLAKGINTRLTGMAAEPGTRPTASTPLVMVTRGTRGKSHSVFKYLHDGPPGLAPSAPPSARKNTDDIPFDDEDDDGKSQNPGGPQWLPKANRDGSYEEEQMAKLEDAGFGSEKAQMWADIAMAKDNLAAHAIIKKEIPPQFQRAAIRVAQEVFKNLDKGWDAADQKLSPKKAWVDDEETGGSFSDAPDDDDETPLDDDDIEPADDPAPAGKPEDEPLDLGIPDWEPLDLGIEDEPEAQQAGASNFLKPDEPKKANPADRLAAMQALAKSKKDAPKTTQAPPPGVTKRPSVSKFFKR